MKSITIRETEIGTGRPKICVPLTAVLEEELLLQAKETAKWEPDLVEWRADFYEGLQQKEKVAQTAKKLRDILGQIPLIFTVRTKKEGGNFQLSTKDYVNILREAAKVPEIDLIDLEFYGIFDQRKEVIEAIQAQKKVVIASNHHFEKTPARGQMETILQEMEASGADIRKLAVMPEKPEDVLELLAATVEANRQGKKPVVTMSMGRMGAVSRVSGEIFGSCITFGTVGASSAPGQLALEDLRRFLEQFHR